MFKTSQLKLVSIEQDGREFHNYTTTEDGEQTVVTINVPELLPKKNCVFKVVTHINEAIYSETNETVTIQNTASLQDKDGHKLTNESDPIDTQEITVNWISKRCTPNEESENGVVKKYITWIVTVNAHQVNIAGKTFKDYLPAGLELDPASLKINNKSFDSWKGLGTYSFTEEPGEITYEAGKKPFKYATTLEFKLNDKLTPAQAHGKYEIKYNTNVIDEEVGEMGFSNVAGIEGFDNKWFYAYKEETISHMTKKFLRYNPDRHTISWSISANKGSKRVESIDITDELPAGLTLVPETLKIGNTSIQSEPTPLGNSEMMAEAKCEKQKNGRYKLTCSIYKQDHTSFNRGYILEFETAIDDKAVYANNVSKISYTNTASATYEGLEGQKLKGIAKAFVNSEVISKVPGEFDNKTKQMTWYIVVNQNGMPIKDLKLIDQLDKNQKYVPGTLQVLKSESYKEWKETDALRLDAIKKAMKQGGLIDLEDPIITDNEEGQLLEYDVGTIEETNTFVLKTVVDTEELFQPNGEDPIFNNSANLNSKDIYAAIKPVSAKKTVINSYIEKFGEQAEQDKPIDWYILVNPNQLKLEDVQVIDTLNKDLKLELEKLKIYKTSVANEQIKSLTFSDIEKLDKTPVQLSAENVDYKKSDNTLSVNLGDIDECYLIAIQTSVLNPKITGEYMNEASIEGIKGVPFTVISKPVTVKTHFSSSWGSGTNPGGTLTVTKTDKDHPEIKLQGAEFKLTNGTYTLTMSTDAEGIAKFEDLIIGGEYILYESKAPEGYIVDDTRHRITVNSENIATTLTNEKIPTDGKLKIIKVNEEDETLKGAVFTLVGNGQEISKTTDENGEALFEELKLNIPYELIETSAPKGYVKLETSELIEFTEPGLIERKITNKEEKGTLKVIKIDAENTSKKLEGVEFTLAGGGKTYTAVTDQEGIALFTDLTLNIPYELKETKALEGYITNSQTEIITFTSAEEVERVIKNEREKGTLKIIKVDAANSDKVLEGAEFTLQGNGKTYKATTNEQGIAIFEGLTLDKEYELTETKAPEGYVESSKVEPIKLTSKEVFEKIITNERDKGTLKIIKVDAANQNKVLEGAEFTLIGDNESYKVVTNEQGIAIFEGLTLDKDYELTESKAPEGYVESSKVEKITLTSKETKVITIANQKEPEPEKGTLKIIKVDAAHQEKVLEGAKFQLVGEGEEYTAITNEQGIAIFGGLTLNKAYKLIEIEAPSGYIVSSEVQLIKLTSREVKVITIVNQKEPEPEKGTIKVIKLDSETEEVLEGAEFKLSFEENEVATATTNSNGEAIFEELPIGREYVLEETAAPQGYILDRTTRGYLVVDSQVIKIRFYNVKESTSDPGTEAENKKGNVQVLKLDKDTNKPLAGAKFTLYVGDNIFSQRTNGNGLAEFKNLPVGERYILEESEPPDGYIKEESTQSGEITTSSALTIYNKKDTSKDPEPKPPTPEEKKGIVEVIKLDEETKKPLEGAEFKLIIKGEEFTKVTDASGKARFEDLPVGSWFALIESKAPEGYILDRTTRGGLIVDSEIIKIEVPNQKVPQSSPEPQPEEKPTPKPTPIKVIVVKTQPEPSEIVPQPSDTLIEDNKEEQIEEDSNIDESASASILDDPMDDKLLHDKGTIIKESNKDALVGDEALPNLGERLNASKLIILLGWLLIILGILERFKKYILVKGE